MKMKSRKGFTLVELMVVILIVGILAAVAIPLMQGRIDKAKWSEANATAGTIRTAVRAYSAETDVATAQTLLALHSLTQILRVSWALAPRTAKAPISQAGIIRLPASMPTVSPRLKYKMAARTVRRPTAHIPCILMALGVRKKNPA